MKRKEVYSGRDFVVNGGVLWGRDTYKVCQKWEKGWFEEERVNT